MDTQKIKKKPTIQAKNLKNVKITSKELIH